MTRLYRVGHDDVDEMKMVDVSTIVLRIIHGGSGAGNDALGSA
jgi:hypothetical protein